MQSSRSNHRAFGRCPSVGVGSLRMVAVLVPILMLAAAGPAHAGKSPVFDHVQAATLLSASFDSGSDGFAYVDDPFLGTSQPAYASGSYQSSGGYSGGGLKVSLGGIDSNAISGMSGGWQIGVGLSGDESGVALSLRYKLTQSAYYEYDESSRVMVAVDGTAWGRGGRNSLDSVSGDGASSQGNSSTFQPTTEWQQTEVFIGDLSAGSHTLVIGGHNSYKNASDESTTILIDDVVLTSGNPAPVPGDVETIVGRISSSQYASYIQTLSAMGDRCRMSGCSPYASYFAAQDWVEEQLTAMGYQPQTVAFTYSGFSGSNVWATKVGTVDPDEMIIIGAHLDGRGGGGAANDDGSGVALVLEAARQLAASDVRTGKSVRFAFWDNEESGLYGSRGYVQDRRTLQGIESPSGSGQYPEPTWLGMIQHDMVLYDHGVGTPGGSQSPYADMDIEWRSGTTKAAESKVLALTWKFLAADVAEDYPANAYDYSTNTDDTPFQPYTAAVSVRENRRSLTSGSNAEWINPYYHTANDVYANYSAADLALGVDTTRTTLGTAAALAGAYLDTTNDPPVANSQAVSVNKNTAKGITLTGSDPEGDPITFEVETAPSHGTLSGTAPNLTYTPTTDYVGSDSFTFVTDDGELESDPATVSITVVEQSGPVTVFEDDFESDLGWVRNPNGTDTATSGTWERGDPESTDSSGPKQLGTTPSGSNDLVTGRLAGSSAGSYDIDGGVTSMRSPSISLPSDSGDLVLTFRYYLAHGSNSSSADYLRLKVIGSSTRTVFEELGAANDDDAAWATYAVSLNAFAGESVRLLIEAADASGSSLVEAAVDDVLVEARPATVVLQASFDAGSESFSYADDTFRGTSQPSYASGVYQSAGGYSGGGLSVTVGGVNSNTIYNMSGGWSRAITLQDAAEVMVRFRYNLTQTPDYESDEYSQALMRWGSPLYGLVGYDYVARVVGNGNGGSPVSTGWQVAEVIVGPMAAGQRTLVLGGYNNKKNASNESTSILIDDVEILTW